MLFPATGFTLDDAIAYYRAVAKFLLPHLRRRPLSFKRYPGTIDDESFWEKDAPPWTPEWVKTIDVARRAGDSVIRYIVVNDAKTLLWLVGTGGIELHPFLHRAPDLENATEVVFDLDPGSPAGIIECCRVAIILRDDLKEVGLESFCKVSGSKGLQVYVPLNTDATHDLTEAFARVVAERLARKHPKLIVAKMAKVHRRGKVFIDYSQNADFKTTVAVYSLRTKREAPFVSMPVTWREVEEAEESGKSEALDFTPDQALQRVRKSGDIFKAVVSTKQKLPASFVGAFAKAKRPLSPAKKKGEREEPHVTVRGVRLPKLRSQSSRRLFVLPKTDTGDELWFEVKGNFRRWILRPDERANGGLIALPAGEFPVASSYYKGEVQKEYRDRVTIEDIGGYEIVEGSLEAEDVSLYFDGKILKGRWRLKKIQRFSDRHRSWEFAPEKGEGKAESREQKAEMKTRNQKPETRKR